MTRVDVISIGELDPGLEDAWRRFQAADPDLRSPFFTPEFCRIVAGVRDDVRIAVISDAGGPTGFFPHHRQRFGRVAPLAGQISDYHGIIGRHDTVGDFRDILRPLGAQAYDFNHAPASQRVFCAHAYLQATSWLVDLSEGFEAWRLPQRAKVSAVKDFERRARKMAREVGPLRFVANETDARVWQALIDWKRTSLEAIGVDLVLDHPWPRAVAEAIRATDDPAFCGMTSALWAGDELVAASFNMRAGATLHSWFPAYNPAFQRYSPGISLMIETLRHAAGEGITEFDFGRGTERYKRELANDERVLCEGSVERGLTPLGTTRKLRKAAQSLADKTGNEKLVDFIRRAGNRLLSAGRLS